MKHPTVFHRLEMPPAAFRRLCIETVLVIIGRVAKMQPPSGGCVLKQDKYFVNQLVINSRLQAAVY